VDEGNGLVPTKRREQELSTEILSFKVTEVERGLIEDRAERLQVSRSEAIRSALFTGLQYEEAMKGLE
jgi:hypothetical protein